MTIRKLEQQLLSRVDPDDLNEVKKIKRYIQLLKLDAACDVAIKKDGATITVENGNQRYIKTHPAMTEKMKINTQLIALEKSIKFKLKTAPTPPPLSTVDGTSKRGSLI